MQKAAVVFGAVMAVMLVARVSRAADEVERTWKAKCASCHGNDGKAATAQGKKMKVQDMTTAAWKKEFPADKIKAAINDGVKREKDGVKQEMKGYKDKLTPEQVDALVKYIEGLK